MDLKAGLCVRVGELSLAPQGLVHGHQLVVERLPQVHPQHAVLAVEHVRRADLVRVFQCVAEHQLAFVVGSDGGVHVVGQPAPLISAQHGREGVLGPGVHHQEQLCEQVIEQGAVHVQVVAELCLELGQPCRLLLSGVHGALVRAFEPGGQCRQVCGVGAVLRVASLEVVLPVRTGEVVAFPQYPVAGVVEDFPALVAFREAEHLRRALVVVEVVLADEPGAVSGVLEHHDGEAVDALAHCAVRFLGRRPVGAGLVVEPHQLHVVGTLRACHVSLEGEGVRWHAVAPQLVLGAGGAVLRESALELDLVVLPGIILGAGALHVRLGAGEGEAVPGRHRVHVPSGDRFLIALVLGQLRRLQDQIGQVLWQLVNDDLAVIVEHLVPVIPLLLSQANLCVRDPVVQHLEPCQVVVVYPDAVDVRGAAVGADGDAHRCALGEVIVHRVLGRTGENAVDVDHQQAVLAALLRHEGQTDVLVLFVLCGNLALLGLQQGLLGRDLQATATAEAGDHHGVIVQHVPGRKLHLDGLAGGPEVTGEDVQRDGHPCVSGHPQGRDAVRVCLPAIRGPVEAGHGRGHAAALPHAGVFLIVAAAIAGEVQGQAVRLRRHVNGALRHRQVDDLDGGSADDRQAQSTGVIRPIGPHLLCAVHRQRGHRLGASHQLNTGRQTGRVVHDVRNGDAVKLLRRSLPEAGGDDGRGIAVLDADEVIVQVVGFHRFAVHRCREPHFQSVAAVALRRDGHGLLPPGGRHSHGVQLRSVQLEMDHLCSRSCWRIRIGDVSGIGYRGVEVALQHQLHCGDVEIQGTGVSVYVRDLQLHRCAADREPLSNVDGHVALLHLRGVLHGTGHNDLQHAAAGGQVVLQAGPVDGQRTGRTVGDGLVDPSGGVGQRQDGVVGLSAATATATTAGGDDLDTVANALTA